jgi:hypothetical protein
VEAGDGIGKLLRYQTKLERVTNPFRQKFAKRTHRSLTRPGTKPRRPAVSVSLPIDDTRVDGIVPVLARRQRFRSGAISLSGRIRL